MPMRSLLAQGRVLLKDTYDSPMGVAPGSFNLKYNVYMSGSSSMTPREVVGKLHSEVLILNTIVYMLGSSSPVFRLQTTHKTCQDTL